MTPGDILAITIIVCFICCFGACIWKWRMKSVKLAYTLHNLHEAPIHEFLQQPTFSNDNIMRRTNSVIDLRII
jgi:hypothetical protein